MITSLRRSRVSSTSEGSLHTDSSRRCTILARNLIRQRQSGYLIVLLVLASLFLQFPVPLLLHAAQERQLENDDLFSVAFPTEQEGWVCGRWGTVLHTEDGGKTWTRQKTPTDYTLTSICFTDPRNGWAVGDGGTIIRTGDGGGSWTRQESPVNLVLMGVCFVNAQKGWAVGERTIILCTEDAGNTWKIQFQDEDFILKSISFCDPQTGWAAGEYGYIYHTMDSGRSWSKQAGEFHFTEEGSDVAGGNFLFDVLAETPMRAWVVGIDGYVARTSDGGKTWERLSGGFPSTQLFTVAVDSNGTIVIGGNGALLMGHGNGDSFSVPEVRPPVTYGWIYGICLRGSSGFAAVGREGSVYLSDSDGALWMKVH
jgi:photosystem II stability/assembly factor-like uncharacterized protein